MAGYRQLLGLKCSDGQRRCVVHFQPLASVSGRYYRKFDFERTQFPISDFTGMLFWRPQFDFGVGSVRLIANYSNWSFGLPESLTFLMILWCPSSLGIPL